MMRPISKFRTTKPICLSVRLCLPATCLSECQSDSFVVPSCCNFDTLSLCQAEDEKRESPAPEKATPVTTTQPSVSKPAPSAPVTTQQPALSKPVPSAAKSRSPPAASQVGSEEVAALRRDLDAMKQELATVKKALEENIEKLESELDEEKMERMKLQVEVDRLKKKNPVS